MSEDDFELSENRDIKSSYNVSSYSVGDIFNSQVYPGIGTLFKIWHCHFCPPAMGRREYQMKIGMRFHPPSNILILIVNGAIKLKIEPLFDPVSNEFRIHFKLHDQPFCLLGERIVSFFKYDFKLLMDNLEVKDIKIVTGARKEPHSPTHITIPQYRTCSVKAKPLIVYQIFSETSNHEKVMIERRYSEFVRLDHFLRNSLPSHLVAALPHLPSKVYNPFFDQNNITFILQRKEKLEQYLNFLLNNEKVNILIYHPYDNHH